MGLARGHPRRCARAVRRRLGLVALEGRRRRSPPHTRRWRHGLLRRRRTALVPPRRAATRRRARSDLLLTSSTQSSRSRIAGSITTRASTRSVSGRALVRDFRFGARVEGGSTLTQQLARTFFSRTSRTTDASEGSRNRAAPRASLIEGADRRPLYESHFSRRRHLRRRDDVVSISAESRIDLTCGEAALIDGAHPRPGGAFPLDQFDDALSAAASSCGDARPKHHHRRRGGGGRARAPRIHRTGSRSERARHGRRVSAPAVPRRFGGDHPPDWQVHTSFRARPFRTPPSARWPRVSAANRRVLEAALVAIDPHTGNMLAMVGGADYRAQHLQPGDAQPPSARLCVQAVRLRGGARATDIAGVGADRPRRVAVPSDLNGIPERRHGDDRATMR